MHTRSRGFTLIEILVVLVIISIISAVAVLSLGTLGRDPPAKHAAEKLTALLNLASDQAVMDGDQYGLRVETHGYEFLRYDGLHWNPVQDDSLLRARHVDSSVQLILHLDGAVTKLPQAQTSAGAAGAELPGDADAASNPPLPQILLLSSGEITPFEITVSGSSASFQISGSLLKGVQMQALDHAAP